MSERPQGTLEGNPSGWSDYIVALEAENERLREALREIEELTTPDRRPSYVVNRAIYSRAGSALYTVRVRAVKP